MSEADKDEIRRILSNIQNNIDFLNRKYPYLEIELEETELTTVRDIDKRYKHRIVVYLPREEI